MRLHDTSAGGHWKLDEKLYFNQRGAKASAADYHAGSGMLVVAFTNGIFDLYELPGFQNVHTLSVTRERISAAAFNAAGNWVCQFSAAVFPVPVWSPRLRLASRMPCTRPVLAMRCCTSAAPRLGQCFLKAVQCEVAIVGAGAEAAAARL